MLTGSDVMAKPLWVKFNEEERKERVDALLRQLDRVEELRESKKAADSKFNSQIEEALDEARRLRAVLRDDGKQMSLADAKVDDMPAEPTKGEAQEALAEVAKRAERQAPRFHKRGELCVSDTCKRRHMTLEQLREGGLEPQGGVLCPGCEKNTLTALEAIKGCCEACQVAKPGDALADAPGAVTCEGCKVELPKAEAVLVDELIPVYACSTCAPKWNAEAAVPDVTEHAAELEAAAEGDEDPRPRCTIDGCDRVLSAEEVDAGNGVCFICERTTAPGMEAEAEEAEA